jgi:VIT family
MHAEPAGSRRVLDPVDRVSEILFGLIMALTFTGTLSAATAGHEDVRTLLIGMVGCNLAWGLVDAVMFLMSTLAERGHNLLTLRAVHAAPGPDAAHQVISGAVPPWMAPLLSRDHLETLRQGLLRMQNLPPAPRLTASDWMGALGVFLLVFLSTLPLVVPFLLFSEVRLALRTSNLIAIVLLFVNGYVLAQYSGYRPFRTGLTMVFLGLVLVAITMALGG